MYKIVKVNKKEYAKNILPTSVKLELNKCVEVIVINFARTCLVEVQYIDNRNREVTSPSIHIHVRSVVRPSRAYDLNKPRKYRNE